MLDKRLKLCADTVKGKRVCDVGTDHAYLIAELLSSGKCETAVAADVNEKPLAAARANLERAGVLDRAEIILSDGLKNVPQKGITDIVIAGMGGELIAKILSECNWLDGVNLILQPMTKSGYLMRFLWENGFEILKRQAVCEGKFCYTVINAVQSEKPLHHSEIPPLFEYIGGLDLSDPNSKEYARRQAESLYTSGKALRCSGRYRQALKRMGLANQIMIKTGGKTMYTVNDIFAEMNVIAPMKNLHKGDNSGLLVGDGNAPVSKVLFALDITREVVLEAAEIGAEAIVAHHPVIFHPLYTLVESNPACLA
ncbi:MAG: tRNA (adenine(22)-N(1))-methyltransferase TrmK, partial [Muribaculaceae bacterium]|nr:tRNA (adenine(22)-N(1))-methyltransferase TrmK [Muribaculaceae bacterium]